MVNLLEAIFLGLVQGLTEWLPISSSGHLVIVQQLLGMEVPLFFDVLLHFGTILAVFAFFWKDILKILKSLFKLDFKSQDGRLGLYIIVGNVPVALTGYYLHDVFESFFSNLFVVALALIITGILLFLTKYTRGRRKLNFYDSLVVGIAQAFSLVPGLSRSGSTISTGLFRGLDRESVFKFSFLLAVPAVIGGNLLELNQGLGEVGLEMVVGTVIAAIMGYLSLKFLFRTLKKGKFYWFSVYCWVVGVVLLLLV